MDTEPLAATGSARPGGRRRGRLRRPREARVLLAVSLLLAGFVVRSDVGLPPPRCQPEDGLPTPTARPTSSVASQGPVGWEHFLRLADLPQLQVGTQARMFSSADPRGGNADGFTGTALCRARNGYVLAEHVGPGELTSLWFTRGDGDVSANGRLRIELDDEVVLDAPLQDVVDGRLGPPFVAPLVGNAARSSGGTYVQVPMPFRRSMRVMTQSVPRFYRVQFRVFADAGDVATFEPGSPPADVIALLRAAGSQDPKPRHPSRRTTPRSVHLEPGQTLPPVRLTGPGAISELRLRLPGQRGEAGAGAVAPQDLRLRLSFDGRRTVDTPVADFFGVGLGERPVASLLFGVDPVEGYRAWWPMPFAREATVSLHNDADTTVVGALEVSWHPDDRWGDALGPDGGAGWFHTTTRSGPVARGRDWEVADLQGHGKLMGLTQTIVGRQPGRGYLEGDERMFIDGSSSPQLHGTGTEDLYSGGWYFNRGPFTTPFSGLSAHRSGQADCPFECDAMYRLLVADTVAYHSGLRLQIEHGIDNQAAADYRTTAFWYGRERPALRPTDHLDVGDAGSERAHEYVGRGRPRRLKATYPARRPGAVVTDLLRETRSEVRFRVAVDPDNVGILLRRRADQRRRAQAAHVLVDGQPAGTWFQAAGNPVRRWLDDDHLLPPSLTRGRSSIEVTLVPLEGTPPWTAASYDVFSLLAGSAATGR